MKRECAKPVYMMVLVVIMGVKRCAAIHASCTSKGIAAAVGSEERVTSSVSTR